MGTVTRMGRQGEEPAGEGEFCLICTGGGTKGERSLAGAQIPSSCHCVAAVPFLGPGSMGQRVVNE